MATPAPAKVSLDQLTRRHGVKVIPAERCSVEEVSVAVAEVVGYKSILSASRMNSAVVLFLDCINKVNDVVVSGIVLNGSLTMVMPLTQPAKKIMLSNVPPFIRDEAIERELSRHGKIVSPIRKIALSCRSAQLKHVVSFRRCVHMILSAERGELNLALKFRVDNFDYVIYASSETMKCFRCGQEGHLIRACPEAAARAQTQNNAEGEGEKDGDEGDNQQENKGEENGNDGNGDGDHSENRSNPEQSVNENNEGKVGEEETETTNNNTGDGVEAEATNNNTGDGVEAEAIINNTGDGVEVEATINNTGDGVEAEVIRDVDMTEDDGLFKTPTLKRKTSSKRRGKKAKKDQVHVEQAKEQTVHRAVSDSSGSADSASESECDSVSSFGSGSQKRSGRSTYTPEKIKAFLQCTKGMKGVRVEDFFPDRVLFIESAKTSMKETGAGGLTDQEVYRLKKIVQKLRVNMLNDEKEAC